MRESKAMPEPIEKPQLDENGNPIEPKKVTYTEEQQADIDKKFNARFAKIKSDHEAEVTRVKEEMQAQFNTLKEELSGKKKDDNKDGKGDANLDQFKELLNQEKNNTQQAKTQADKFRKEAEETRTENMRIRKENAIRDACKGCGFYDENDVLSLTSTKVEWSDEHKDFIVKENGVIKQNSALEPMTLKEFYRSFAQQKPHLVNGDVLSGSGSSENGGGASSFKGEIKAKADLKDLKSKMEYITKFGLDVYEKLPLK